MTTIANPQPIVQQLGNQPIQEEIVTTSTTTTSNLNNSNLAGTTNTNSNATKGKRRSLFGRRKAQSTNNINSTNSGLYNNSSYNSGLSSNGLNNGSNNGYNNGYAQDVLVNPIGVADVTHHSYRWAHRDKNLLVSDAYGGAPPRGTKVNRRNRRSGNNSRSNLQQQPVVSQTQTNTTSQGLTGYPQQTFQTTITEEVPMNNNGYGNNNVPANNIPAQKKRSHPFQSLFGRKHHDSGAHAGMLGSGPTGGLGLPSRANTVY